MYLNNKLRSIKVRRGFRDDKKFLNGICKVDESGRLSGLGPLEWFLTLNLFDWSKLMAIGFKRNCAKTQLSSPEIPTSISQCLQATKWESSAENEKEALTMIARGRARFIRADGLETAMIQMDHCHFFDRYGSLFS